MSFWKKIFGVKDSGTPNKIILADVMALGGGSNRLPPKVQIDILHALSRYAEKENVTMHAMLTGEVLRSVPENEPFRNIKVSYAASVQELPALAEKLVKSYGRKGVVVITSNRQVEDDARQAGAALMRANTFKKALAGGPQGEGGDRGGDRGGGGQPYDRNRRNRNRPRRERPPQSQQQESRQPPEAVEGEKRPEKAPEKKSEAGGISDLIDLV
ncbi:MAG: hypothetical protein AB7T27_07770 [Kiritimatiellia bacterium]